MKKKYLALLLSCMIVTPCFLSSCGKIADETAVEEDEEDEDEDEEDEDDDKDDDKEDEEDAEESEKPEEPAIVKEIADEDLYAQIDLFLKNRDDILFPESEDYAYTTCMLCDLDHNGRCELILSGARWYGANSECRIYEINEDCDGIYQPDFEYLGVDADDGFTDFNRFASSADGYYNKEDGTFHYIIWESLPDNPSNTYGSVYCDITLRNGTIENNMYGKYTYQYIDSGYVYEYFGPDGEMDEDDFHDYIDTYADGRVIKPFHFGIYEGDYYFPVSDGDIETMDSDKLAEVLADSYRVFIEKMTRSDYVSIHSLHSNPYDDPQELLEDSIGSWGIYLTDTEGDVTYYEPGDAYYMLLDVYEDGSIYVQRYMNTEYENDLTAQLEEYDPGMLRAIYTPDPKDDMYYDYMELVIREINTDGMLVLSTSSWRGNEYLGGSEWYFVRLD